MTKHGQNTQRDNRQLKRSLDELNAREGTEKALQAQATASLRKANAIEKELKKVQAALAVSEKERKAWRDAVYIGIVVMVASIVILWVRGWRW